MNLRRGLYSEQPDVNFQRSPIAEEPPVLMATTGPLLFGRSECHQRGLLETKDKRGADRVRKRWEIWTQWGYSFDSLSLRARQNACWLLGGVHSTPLQCQPGVSENHHRPWAHPLPLLVCVCARVCVCVSEGRQRIMSSSHSLKAAIFPPCLPSSSCDGIFLVSGLTLPDLRENWSRFSPESCGINHLALLMP